MNSILIQDITKNKFKDDSLPTIAYGDYGGVCDESIDYIDAVGVGDDRNIYMASCYEELENVLHSDSVMLYTVTGVSTVKGLINALRFLSLLCKGFEETAKVYVKNYEGYVLPVQEIIDDRDSERFVFVTQEQVVDSYV